MTHAFLSASGSHRWLNCTMSPTLESGIDDTTSFYAKEGTLAHEIAELILNKKWRKDSRLINDSLFYDGMVEQVEIYTSYCIEKYNEYKTRDKSTAMFIEKRLDFSDYVPEGHGTGDCVLIGDETIEVIDLKFGKGVTVDPVENSQLMLYGLGAVQEFGWIYPIKNVVLTVAQVRLGGISSYRISLNDLIKWGNDYVKPRAEKAMNGKGEIVPGEWCRFCKFKNQCKVRAEKMIKIAEMRNYKDSQSLSTDEMADILSKASEISQWIKDIETYALEQALEGVEYPGYKLVEGRSNRRLTDEALIAEKLIKEGFKDEDIYKPKSLEGITKLERLVGKGRFSELVGEYIEKPRGKPVLALETDRRKPYFESEIEDEFEFN